MSRHEIIVQWIKITGFALFVYGVYLWSNNLTKIALEILDTLKK